MSRRTALPGADELFRTTAPTLPAADAPAEAARASAVPHSASAAAVEASAAVVPQGVVSGQASRGSGRPLRAVTDSGLSTGRERHDQKITVYLSAEELVALDEAKAALFRDHGLKVDRGRIVREAAAVVIADLAAKGEHGVLVRRLRER